MDILWNSFLYISSAPYFWLSMGMTTAVAMFVGAIIFDGNMKVATKGIIGVFSYGFFVLQVNYTRVSHMVSIFADTNKTMAYGGIVTLGVVSLFWIIGILLGVCVSSNCRAFRKFQKKGRG